MGENSFGADLPPAAYVHGIGGEDGDDSHRPAPPEQTNPGQQLRGVIDFAEEEPDSEQGGRTSGG
jgi:hypothetical protein